MLGLQPSSCFVWFFEPENPLYGNVLSVSSSHIFLEFSGVDARQGRTLFEQLCEYEFFHTHPNQPRIQIDLDRKNTRLDISLVMVEGSLLHELIHLHPLTFADVTERRNGYNVSGLQVALKECQCRIGGVTRYVAANTCGVFLGLEERPERDWLRLKLHLLERLD